MCGCIVKDKKLMSKRIPWGGESAGAVECREYSFFARVVFHKGKNPGYIWKPCGPNDPGASLDFERLYKECTWNAEKARWEQATCRNKTAI